MAKAKNPQKKATLLKELNLLRAIKKVAVTDEGTQLIDFILIESKLHKDPMLEAKNSGETANIIGKQSVGRALIDKLIESGTQINGAILSQKKSTRIDEIEKDINILLQGEK
jgi:hypothetical protein